jgi:hypothetical protein
VELEINPPRGPKWTDDVSTHLGFLVDQLPTFSARKGSVTLSLEAPIVVPPGGRIFLEGLVLNGAAEINTDNVDGWIAAMLMGHQEVPDDYDR